MGANTVAIIGRGNFACPTLTTGARGTCRAVVSTKAAVLRICGEIEAARTAVDQSSRAVAEAHGTGAAGSTIDAAGTAVLGVGRRLDTGCATKNGCCTIASTCTHCACSTCWACHTASPAIGLIGGNIYAIGSALRIGRKASHSAAAAARCIARGGTGRLVAAATGPCRHADTQQGNHPQPVLKTVHQDLQENRLQKFERGCSSLGARAPSPKRSLSQSKRAQFFLFCR